MIRRERKPYCGNFSLAGQPQSKQETQYVRLNCKCWACAYCGPKRARLYKHAIRRVAEELHLQRFLTLTLDPQKIEGDPVRYLRSTFGKLRTYLRRKYGVAPKYIAVLEFHKSGVPHLHVLIDRFIEQAWLSRAWEAIGGGGIVDIRFVDLHRVSRYLAKYLTLELLLSGSQGARRVTCARGITLLEKPSPADWRLLKTTIFHLYSRLFPLVSRLQYDEENTLVGFVVTNHQCERKT